LVGATHLLLDVLGDAVVEDGFIVRQGVARAVGATLREEGRSVELEQALLNQPAHQV
jgi:hypothetical protein